MMNQDLLSIVKTKRYMKLIILKNEQVSISGRPLLFLFRLLVLVTAHLVDKQKLIHVNLRDVTLVLFLVFILPRAQTAL